MIMSRVKDVRLEEKEEYVVRGTILADEFRNRRTGEVLFFGYSKAEIDAMLTAIREGQYIEVNTTLYPTLESFLESTGRQGTVYLYPVGNTANNYYQYIWEVNQWKSLGTTELDLSNYYNKTESDSRFAKLEQGFNVLNASEIVNNTLTQDQYDLITNGKPTLIKGNWGSYSDLFLLPPRNNTTYFEYIGFDRYRTVKINVFNNLTISSSTAPFIQLQNIDWINGKAIPPYPSNTGTFTMKCVDGTLSWQQEWYGTQTEYDNLGTYDSNTIYNILES